MDLPIIAECSPQMIITEPGKVYSWCSCGLSEKQPLCDGAHNSIEGTPYKSIKVQFDNEEKVLFCQCKHTKTPPFCDDTHLQLAISNRQ